MWQAEQIVRSQESGVRRKSILDSGFCLLTSYFLLLSFCLGCGYHFLGQDRSPLHLPVGQTGYRKIAIPTFYNDTFEPLIEKRITRLVKEEFSSNGILQVINDPAQADLTLTGRITGFNLIPISFTSDNRVREYRVSIKVDVSISAGGSNPGQKDKGYILQERGREATAEYLVPDDITANRIAEDRAIDEAGRLFAEDLVSQVLEGL